MDEVRLKPGQRIASLGRTVARNNLVTDGPFCEAREVIGGYWFIVAGSLEAAARIAAGNPCPKSGLSDEIRPTEAERASACEVTTETPMERREQT